MTGKKASFLFVYPDTGTKSINFSPSIQLLSAVLKQQGHDTRLIHINDAHGTPDTNDSILKEAHKQHFDIAGFTATSFQYTRANEIAGLFKKKFPGIPLILGGTHATIKPDDLAASNFDAFCIGEGDEALPELVETIANGTAYHDTANFHVKLPDGTINKNPVRPFIKDLNRLPFWDMDIHDMHTILKVRRKWLSISFSRGCPYECTFCINPLLLKINMTAKQSLKEYLRKRTPEHAVQEIRSIVEKFGDKVAVINFDDDLLMLDKKWMLAFTEQYRKDVFIPYKVRYVMNCRVNTIDDEIAKHLAESGCLELRIGFETGDETLRNKILNKKVTNDQLVKAFGTADRHGIHTNAFTMMGIPGESEQTIQETVRMVSILKPYLMRMTFLYPYYNTHIYDFCAEKGLIKKEYATLSDSFTESPLTFEQLTDVQLLQYRFLFPWYTNLILCGEHADRYRNLIKKYKALDLARMRKQETFDKILGDDTALSAILTEKNIPHYKYFSNNLYYFQLKGKYGF